MSEHPPTSPHTEGGAAPNVLESSRQLLTTFVSMFQTRVALAGVELAEEKARLIQLALTSVVGLLFVGLTLMAFTGLVAVLCWDSYRWQALLGLTVLYGAIAAYCYGKVRCIIDNAPALLEATLAEIEKDREALRR